MAAKPAKKDQTPIETPRSARLGDETPAAAPRTAREPVNVIVAKSDIDGGKVHINLQKVGPVRAVRGQTLYVKHVYRLQEDSPEEEEYRFLLRSSLGGKEHSPSLARFGDVYAITDDVGGYLVHEYKLDKVGTHALEFSVGTEYVVMGWKDHAVKAMDRQELKGSIQVTVA